MPVAPSRSWPRAIVGALRRSRIRAASGSHGSRSNVGSPGPRRFALIRSGQSEACLLRGASSFVATLSAGSAHGGDSLGHEERSASLPAPARPSEDASGFPAVPPVYSGQETILSSGSILRDSRTTLPRTEIPARWTVSGSPETSGCHQNNSFPSATSR